MFGLDDMVSAAVIGGAFDMAGGILEGTFSSKQASRNRDWQERMSSTAHQREVADLRAAGLNPILSATGGKGASTPGGATAETPKLGNKASSAVAMARLKSEVNLMKDQGNAAKMAAARDAAQADYYDDLQGQVESQINYNKALTDMTRLNMQLQALQLPSARAQARFYDSPEGELAYRGQLMGGWDNLAKGAASEFVAPVENFLKDMFRNPKKYFPNMLKK